MSLLEAIRFAHDSSTLVKALSTQRHEASEFYAIVYAIKNQLSLNCNFIVKFIRQQTNMTIHTLVRAAVS